TLCQNVETVGIEVHSATLQNEIADLEAVDQGHLIIGGTQGAVVECGSTATEAWRELPCFQGPIGIDDQGARYAGVMIIGAGRPEAHRGRSDETALTDGQLAVPESRASDPRGAFADMEVAGDCETGIGSSHQ